MIIKHLLDEQLQQFAFDEGACDASIRQHVAICKHCKEEATGLRLMFAEIKKLPQPTADYDLAALVVARLPQPAVQTNKNLLAYVVMFAASVLLVLPVCLFWRHFAKISVGVLPEAIWSITAVSSSIMIISAARQYLKYKRKIATIGAYPGLI